jgi:SAM-dependent methyltransferase
MVYPASEAVAPANTPIFHVTAEGQGSAKGGSIMTERPSFEGILQVAFGFWASKALLSAVEIGLFTELADGPLDAGRLTSRLGIQNRGARDLFDALVGLGMLNRDDGQYSNTAATDFFLDRSKPTYIGGLLEMANSRLYPFWGSLTEALRTGQPQNEAIEGAHWFTDLYKEPARTRVFLQGMTGLSIPSADAIAAKFPWSDYQTFVDVGTAQGGLPVQVALAHEHLTGAGFDLPSVGPIFDEYVNSFGLGHRLRFLPGDFFKDPLPQADVLVMGHILHDWNLEEKLMLLRKAHEALAPGGALIVYDNILDDERRINVLGLLESLDMLIETPGGFEYTQKECSSWMREVGFREIRIDSLDGPESMAVGIK